MDEEIAPGKLVTFTDLCRLRSLSIRYHFGQQDVACWQLAAVAVALDTLQQLVKLSVDFNSSSITDEGCQALGGEVSKLLQLTFLELVVNSNNVGPGGCQALGDGLGKLLQLTTLSLDLGWNSVGDGGCRALSPSRQALTADDPATGFEQQQCWSRRVPSTGRWTRQALAADYPGTEFERQQQHR